MSNKLVPLAVLAAGFVMVPPANAQRAVPSTVGGCSALARRVNTYNTLTPGSSRTQYLTLLHTLQRDCPAQAVRLGLTGSFLPTCKRLGQENCTMYRKKS